MVALKIPLHLQNQSVPIVSYSSTKNITPEVYTYEQALQDLDLEEYNKNYDM